jgi:hypothetical protein
VSKPNKKCKQCKVLFLNPCPFKVGVDTRSYKPAIPLDLCPSCYHEKYPDTTWNKAELLSHHTNTPRCQACPSYIKCMTVQIGNIPQY